MRVIYCRLGPPQPLLLELGISLLLALGISSEGGRRGT